MENPLSVTNSKISEVSLRLLVASPVATRLLEDGHFSESKQGKKVEKIMVPYDTIGKPFVVRNLVMFEITHKSLLPLLLFSCLYSSNNTVFFIFAHMCFRLVILPEARQHGCHIWCTSVD